MLHLLAIIVLLLIVFASRVQFLTNIPIHIDEARAGMRIMGTPAEIIAWQPPDWPPLHNLLLAAWSVVAGQYPFSLRLFSAFFSLLSVAIAYPMAYRLTHDRRIALGTMIVYGGLGMTVFLGIFIRGYAQVMALFPLAIWLTVRYFESHRLRDAFALAVTMGLMFVSTYTSVTAFIFLVLLSCLRYIRQLWRWIVVGIFASPFAFIEIFRKWDFWFARVGSNAGTKGAVYNLLETFILHYREYVGQLEWVWLLLGIVAILFWIWQGRQHGHLLLWVMIAGILAPLITLFLVESRVFVLMSTRYSWWVLIILSLGLAIGLRYLPRIIWLGVMLIILGLMLTLPLRKLYYYEPSYVDYFESNLEWLRQRIQPGDVLMFDPNLCKDLCRNHDEIAYYWEVYLGDQIAMVDSPGDYRRIWLWRGVGHSRDLLKELKQTHIATMFYGPPISLLELYEAPPDPDGILYDNGMRFHGFDIVHPDGRYDLPPYDVREQTSIVVRLWWSADRPIDRDYQVSLQMHNATARTLLTQNDGAPNLIHLKPNAFEPLPKTTADWLPNQLYVDTRILNVPDTREEVLSDLYLIIYSLPDGQRVSTVDRPSDGLLPLSETVIWGWG